ncbi:MAG: protease complex subunit PrcB family protein [Chloroflexota bacterium]|nr:protease complex subunit PrcB family protein [Chloroflexota bacterium]
MSRLVGIEIVDRAAAAIEIAFDAGAAAELVAPLPADADFATQAVLCLFIGERNTGGWAVTVQSIRIVEGRMEITARETEPRGGTATDGATYPADCVLIDRSVLPVGSLPVTSTDTTSDEFIIDGAIDVPAPAGAP